MPIVQRGAIHMRQEVVRSAVEMAGEVVRVERCRVGVPRRRVERPDDERSGLLGRFEVRRREAEIFAVGEEQRRVVLMRVAPPCLRQRRRRDHSLRPGHWDAGSGRRDGQPGQGGYGAESGAVGCQRRKILPALHADDGRFAQVAQRQLHDAEAGERVEQHRQHGNHEDGAAVAQLVAQLSHPDETNDGPAHERTHFPPERTERARDYTMGPSAMRDHVPRDAHPVPLAWLARALLNPCRTSPPCYQETSRPKETSCRS